MKKSFIVAFLMLIFAMGSLSAQKVVFPTDNRGKICYTNEFETDQSKAELFESANLWVVSTFHSRDAVFSKDMEKGELLANGTMRSKSDYKPSVGHFSEYVTFIIKFNVSDGKIQYILYHPTLLETYVGYGTNKKIYDMDELYQEYVKAYESKALAKSDPTLSKKERKSFIKVADDFVKEKEKSLELAADAMQDVVRMLESNLFR